MWQVSNDKITWVNVPDRASAMFCRYVREPKPGEVWAYGGHTIGEVLKVERHEIYAETLFFKNDHPCMYWNEGSGWTYVSGPQPAAKDIPSPVTSCAPGTSDKSTEAARGGEAATTRKPCARPGCTRSSAESMRWCGYSCAMEDDTPSAVAAAPAIEPWRPTVDDDFWIPNASEGWRR